MGETDASNLIASLRRSRTLLCLRSSRSKYNASTIKDFLVVVVFCNSTRKKVENQRKTLIKIINEMWMDWKYLTTTNI